MKKYISRDSQQFFAFNIWNIESARAVLDAAERTGCDVILQTSMKAFESLDKELIRYFVTHYTEGKGIRAFLHLDHCRELDPIKYALRSGWDSVMIDASHLSLADNINVTNEVYGIAAEKGALVEAEVGRITGTQEECCVIEEGVAKIEDVSTFLENAKADMLAVAIGTAHGLYKGEPRLHYRMIEQIAKTSAIPLVIHGGTGLPDEALLRLLSYGNIKKINISTDVKLAYLNGIEQGGKNGYLEKARFDPLKVEKSIHDSIMDMAVDKLKLFAAKQNG